jgi:hypothetical protein
MGVKMETEKEELPRTASEAARKRFEAYLDEKLRGAYDSEIWEFYTFLLEKAESRKVDRSGYLPGAYLNDCAAVANNAHKKD